MLALPCIAIAVVSFHRRCWWWRWWLWN